MSSEDDFVGDMLGQDTMFGKVPPAPRYDDDDADVPEVDLFGDADDDDDDDTSENIHTRKRNRIVASSSSSSSSSSSESSSSSSSASSDDGGDLISAALGLDEDTSTVTSKKHKKKKKKRELKDLKRLTKRRKKKAKAARPAPAPARDPMYDAGDSDSGGDAGADFMARFARESVPKANVEEEEEQPVAAKALELDVRAHEIISMFPPTMVFMAGKTASAAFEVTLVGDLVMEMSSPLHMFTVKVEPADADADPSDMRIPQFVVDIIKVVNGPIVKAQKEERDRAAAALALHLPPVQIKVTLTMLKSAINKSKYFSDMLDKPRYVDSIMRQMRASMNNVPMNAPIPANVLEKFAHPDGSTPFDWACRNALADWAFFRLANEIGGRAARHLLSGPECKATLEVLDGTTTFNDDVLDDDARLDALKTVHFANTLSGFRAHRLHETVGVNTGSEALDHIMTASRIFHQLPIVIPGRKNEEHTIHAIAWSGVGDVWIPPVRRLLEEHDICTQQTPTGRWFACRKQTQEYYKQVADMIETGVSLVRAETDDDHDASDGGYINFIRKAVRDHAPKLVITTTFADRLSYLQMQTSSGVRSAVFATTQLLGPRTIQPGYTIIVDRVHQIPPGRLMDLLRMYSEDAGQIILCGSTWAGVGRSRTTIFSQMFDSTSGNRCTTLSSTLTPNKVAQGRDPTQETRNIPRGARIFLRTRREVPPPALRAAFPAAPVAYIDVMLGVDGYQIGPASIVAADSSWTREDLAVVWQTTVNAPDAIWFTGGTDWGHILSKPARGKPSSAVAVMRT